jgi:O-antigen ligase/tetratricopeptide (TPR) repeat protein
MNLQKTLRALVVGLLFLIPFFPLIVANPFFFPFITGKAFYFRIIVELAFAGWVILAFLDAKYRPKFTPLLAAISIFTLVALIADILGVNPLRSIWSNFERMEGWLVVIHLWAFFVTATSIFGTGAEGHRMWHRWLNATLGVASIVGLYGFAQLFGLAAIHQGSTRIDASLGNAAYMAVYMLIHAFMAAYMFFGSIKSNNDNQVVRFIAGVYSLIALSFILELFTNSFVPWYVSIVIGLTPFGIYFLHKKLLPRGLEFLYLLGFTVFSFLVFQTSTRGTIIGLIGGIVLSLSIYAILGKKEHLKNRWIAVGAIAIILAIGGIFWANRNTDFVKNNEILNRLASISINESKTQARGYIWPMAIVGFKERPILGWGQENFNYIFNANYNPQMWTQEQWFDRAHSVYLDWLTASGLVGLLAYLSLYVFAMFGIWKSKLSVSEKSVLTGLVASYAVHNVFVFDNLASYTMFFVVLGFISSLHEGKTIKWMGTVDMRRDAVEYIVAPIVIVLLVASVYFLNIRPIQANTGLISALQVCANGAPDLAKFQKILDLDQYIANQEIREQILSCTNSVIAGSYPNPIKQGFFTLASEQIMKQISVTPNDARAYALAGSFYNSLGQYTLATPVLEKAVLMSPDKQSIALQLVNSYASQGKNDEAIAILKHLYEITPAHTDVRNSYARILVLTNREAEARQLFDNDSALFDNEFVAQIYASQKKYTQAIALFQKLIASSPKDINLRVRLSQVFTLSGSKWQATETLKTAQKDFPEYKTQLEAMIKESEK